MWNYSVLCSVDIFNATLVFLFQALSRVSDCDMSVLEPYIEADIIDYIFTALVSV